MTERAALLVVTLLAAVTGCGSDPPTPREAVPRLSLRGTTSLSDARAQGLTPALVFLSPRGDAVVDGSVSGEFPAAFRLDVTGPPPATAMLELSPEQQELLRIRGPMAEGLIALVPAEHPRLLAQERTLSQECDAARTRCTRKTSACDGERCRERTYDCERRQCEELGTSGAETAGQGYITRGIACAGHACYQSVTSCTPAGDCFGVFTRCTFDRATTAVDFGSVHTCEVVEQSGDDSILTLSDLPYSSTTHYVSYVTVDHPGFNGLDLVSGYNIVESSLRSPEEYMESVDCATRVELEVLAEYNALNGTAFDLLSAPAEMGGLVRDRRALDCERATTSRVVPNALETPLALELGAYPGL